MCVWSQELAVCSSTALAGWFTNQQQTPTFFTGGLTAYLVELDEFHEPEWLSQCVPGQDRAKACFFLTGRHGGTSTTG